MKYRAILFLLAFCIPLFAGNKKTTKVKNILTPISFDGITVGESKSGVQAKGFRCQDIKIGDYLTLHECRHDIEFAGEHVQAYATLNDAGSKVLAVGFDTLFPGDDIKGAQDMFYKFETAVQDMLGSKPAITKTPDTYIAMTDFIFPKTVVSCFLFSDDRTKPPKLRCGCEVRAGK